MSSLDDYLKKHKLTDLKMKFKTLNLDSVEMLSLLPEDEDVEFADLFQVDTIRRIRLRILLADIRKNNSSFISPPISTTSTSTSTPVVSESPRKKQKTSDQKDTELTNNNDNVKHENTFIKLEQNHGTISGNFKGNNNGSITHHYANHNNVIKEDIDKYLSVLCNENKDIELFCRIKLVYQSKSKLTPAQVFCYGNTFDLKYIQSNFYKNKRHINLGNKMKGIVSMYQTKVRQHKSIFLDAKSFEEQSKLAFRKDKQNINLSDILFIMLYFFNVNKRVGIVSLIYDNVNHGVNLDSLNMIDIQIDFSNLYNRALREQKQQTNGNYVSLLKQHISDIEAKMVYVLQWFQFNVCKDVGLKTNFSRWLHKKVSMNMNMNMNMNMSMRMSMNRNNNNGKLCRVCKVYVPSGLTNWTAHVEGKRHMMNLKIDY